MGAGAVAVSGTSRARLWAVVAACIFGAPLPVLAQETVTTLDGVYTAEQAARGKQIYQRSCVGCHALDWYRGDMVRAWEGAPLFGLFEVISTKMPEDNPGSLSRRQYVDMLAYILELNGMPVGDQELSTGASRLRQILFQWRDPS